MVSERDLPPEFAREISTFTLRVCTPIYWHDRRQPFPKDVQGAARTERPVPTPRPPRMFSPRIEAPARGCRRSAIVS